MYRPSNDRYSENASNMKPHNNNPFPGGEHSMSKMGPPEAYPSMPPPLYDYPNSTNNPNNYDYPPHHASSGPPDNFERPYPPSWREVSEPKGHMMPPMGPPSMHPGQFDMRPMHGAHGDGPSKDMPPYLPNPAATNPSNAPQVNVVHRISGLIKSQLNSLHSILSYADKKTAEERGRKDRSRSRSRDRGDRGDRFDRGDRGGDRVGDRGGDRVGDRGGDRGNDRGGRTHHREWNCPKCNFLNFDFRDKCKKCNESKPGDREERPSGNFKNYVPGPEDWRCFKCNNINYARRTECHRCHVPKGK